MTESSGADAPLAFFAAAARGTEPALVSELARIGVDSVHANGGVSFHGDLAAGYMACVWSRVATRVTVELGRSEIESEDEHYSFVRELPWEDHLHLDRTFAVAVSGRHHVLQNSRYAALRTKDAIVDRFRDRSGSRPNVDTDHPNVRVHVALGSSVVVSLELAGRMHRRGYRSTNARAPLRESLAAALLEMTEWDGSVPLIDPMCGSGTIAIEAGLRVLNVAPGLLRNRRGPEAWRGHDSTLWSKILDEAEAARRSPPPEFDPPVLATDAVYQSVQQARDAVKQLGLVGTVAVGRSTLVDATPYGDQAGLVVTNPPYGERIGTEREWIPLYQLLGDVLKRRFGGWTAWVLSGSPKLSKHIGLRPSSRHTVFNGALECRYLEFPIQSVTHSTSKGPGWRKPSAEAEMFANRLSKNLRRLRPWAEREGISAFRAYNRDIPEYNVAVDIYDCRVRVEEFAPPRSVDAETADRRLQDVLLTVGEALSIAPDLIALRVRARRGGHEQDGLRGDAGRRFPVEEYGLRFVVNVDDYLDTGLFLDDRVLRSLLRKESRGKRVLNLFAYTCTASVAAAVGGASSVTSVDRSARYLDWGRANFDENQRALDGHTFVAADVREWLKTARRREQRFDLVFCSPPTFSRAKGENDFDVVRDYADLIEAIGAVLAPGGSLLFATNKRHFKMTDMGRGWKVASLGKRSVPRDFAGSVPHQAFWLTRR